MTEEDIDTPVGRVRIHGPVDGGEGEEGGEMRNGEGDEEAEGTARMNIVAEGGEEDGGTARMITTPEGGGEDDGTAEEFGTIAIPNRTVIVTIDQEVLMSTAITAETRDLPVFREVAR
jgi:hypothetical protein